MSPATRCLFHKVGEDEYLFGCAPVLSKTSLFLSKGTIYSVLDPLNDDSPHYFAVYRSPLQIFLFRYLDYQAVLPFLSSIFFSRYILLNNLVSSFSTTLLDLINP